jgi:hypothetical protein
MESSIRQKTRRQASQVSRFYPQTALLDPLFLLSFSQQALLKPIFTKPNHSPEESRYITGA